MVSSYRRQRPVSCHFCRVRKLRCSRQFPCTNCTSRGVECRQPPDPPTSSSQSGRRSKIRSQAPDSLVTNNGELLRRLERLEAVLAVRHQEPPLPESPSTSAPEGDPLPEETSPDPDDQSLPSRMQNIMADALFLERNCMGPQVAVSALAESIIFRTCPIRLISQASSYVFQSPSFPSSSLSIEPTKCIWLPEREETKMITEKYIEDLSLIHHIVHSPSLRRTVDELYDILQQQGSSPQIPIGSVVLVLSLCANVTYLWTALDAPRNLFVHESEAHAQSVSWTKAAFDVLDNCQRNSHISIEALQGVALLGFVMCNFEGINIRVRNLLGRGLTMARELGLHRIDEPHPASSTEMVRLTGVRAEVGRRLWWYMCATDWMLARFSGALEGVDTINPERMAVNRPKNIEDEDLVDGKEMEAKPPHHPTCMSYFLERLRLAELSRDFTKKTPFSTTSAEVLGIDRVQELERRLQDYRSKAPAFFALDYDLSRFDRDGQRHSNRIAIQRYVFHLFLLGQRLKIHLPYLARGAIEPAYAQSREACLQSARQIIQTEHRLEKENISFASTRLRMTIVLHSVFLASIALLLDVCLGPDVGVKAASPEVVDAWRILQAAKPQSNPAAKLHELLSQILKKHNVTLPVACEEETTRPPTETVDLQKSFPLTPSSTSRGFSGGLTQMEASSALSQDWHCLGEMNLDSVDWDSLLGVLDAPFI